MNENTTRRRRNAGRAAAFATIAAVAFGAAACGTESASENTEPAHPASAPKVYTTAHAPISADAAERQGAAKHRAQTPTPVKRGYPEIPTS